LTQKEGWYRIWSLWPTRFRIRGQFWCFHIFACSVMVAYFCRRHKFEAPMCICLSKVMTTRQLFWPVK